MNDGRVSSHLLNAVCFKRPATASAVGQADR